LAHPSSRRGLLDQVRNRARQGDQGATARLVLLVSYSFTLHAPDGTRLVGFDNAHGVPAKGSRFKPKTPATDHGHRTETDPGRPYPFKDAETLIDDFFDEVERVLGEREIGTTVIEVEETRRSK
jgi:hypothetical protein